MATDPLIPIADSLPALVDLRAKNSPSKVFIDFAAPTSETPRITFEDFRKLSIASGYVLRSLGISPGHRLAILSPNSLVYVLMLFGAQRIGAVPMPLNTALPIETVIALLRVGNCSALIASKIFDLAAIQNSLPAIIIIPLEDYSVSHLNSLADNSLVEGIIRPSDVALILHTSGTLKQPKLVPLTHRNLLANREAVVRHWAGLLTDSDATLGWMPYYHVIGLAHDLMGQLYVCGRYVMAQLPPNQPIAAQVLADLLVSARPTIFYCVPWILDQMRPIISSNPELMAILRNLKLLMSGGVALSGPLSTFFHDNKIPLVDGLGMTDTAGAILLGDPRIANGNLRLLEGLSAEFAPVPGLEAAELRFRAGPCITSGYLNDAEANAACFIEGQVFRTFDLFECVSPAERIYRYCGRIDDIFALDGGEKANPLPIEFGISESCALIRRVALLGNRRPFLIAVLEPKPEALASMSAAALGQSIWQAINTFNPSIPAYARLRRRALIILPPGTPIPVTPKGSVKRHELEKLMAARMEAIYADASDLSHYDGIRDWFAAIAKDASRLTVSAVADALTRVLERLLDLPSLGAADLSAAFASLGIDSQRAVQLAAAASRTFSLDLKATLVFQHSSPAELAAYIYRAITAQQLTVRTDRFAPRKIQARSTSIAVTGYAMRFPGGVRDEESFWTLLTSGSDAITVPIGRAALTDALTSEGAYTLRAGYLREDLSRFDVRVFRMSEQEASHLDPQQRLLLELTLEALEQAFLANSAQRSALRIGVWVGLSSHDFELHLLRNATVGRFSATGSSFATAAGRIAYTFDLKGPSLTVDTACSSSLVATHLARQALLSGEVDVAIVGSANVILAPEPWIAACKAKLLSPTGVCRAFDIKADGYVRAEGAAVVVLRPLDAAVKAGNVVHGCLLGSAVNQDGHSNGFTAPQGSAQEEVIRAALSEASLAPTDIQVVETHGTGTALGDPVELDALTSAYGPRSQSLALGALKSVTGHMEACAGLGGLIKTLISMQRASLPPHPHFTKLNTLASQPSSVSIATTTVRWPSPPPNGRRRAGLSSFGISGTNSHVIIEEAPATANKLASPDPRKHHICALSAASPAALASLRTALHASPVLQHSLSNVCYTLATTRAELPYRWSATAATIADLRSQLATPLGDLPAIRTRKIAFLFPGQGSLLRGLGKELWTTEPVFRQAMTECNAILSPLLGFSLAHKLYESTEAIATSATLTQCTLISIGVALSRLLASWGVRPDAVLGHSSGELTAAHVAGLLSLQDALNFAVLRGRLMDQAAASRPGAMLAIFAPLAEVTQLVQKSGQEQLLSIAAHNGPQHTVVSGAREAVESLAAQATEKGMKMKELGNIATAFHSVLLDPILDQFEQTITEKLRFDKLRLPLVSSATGQFADTQLMSSAAHWRAQLRGTVRFHEAVQTLQSEDVTVWLELGSRATLLGLIRRAIVSPNEAYLLPCLARTDNSSDAETLMSSVGSLWQAGVAVDWAALHAPFVATLSLVPNLPTYWFDRKSFWFTENAVREPAKEVVKPQQQPNVILRTFNAEEPYALADHLVHSRAVIPGAAHLLYLAEASHRSPVSVSFLQAVIIEDPPSQVTYRIDRNSGTVETRSNDKTTVHVECTLAPTAPLPALPPFDTDAIILHDASAFYSYAAERQLHCGPSFRWIRSAHTSLNTTRVTLDRAEVARQVKLTAGFMDCVLQCSFFVFADEERSALHLPIAVGEAHFASDFTVALPAMVHVQRVQSETSGVCVDLVVAGADNKTALHLRRVVFRRFVKNSFFRTAVAQSIYEIHHENEALATPGQLNSANTWKLVGSDITALLKCKYPSLFTDIDKHPRVLYAAPDFDAAAAPWSAGLQQCALAIRDALVSLSADNVTSQFTLVSKCAPVVPLQALAALLRTARLEFPSVTIRHIDVTAIDDITAESLMREVSLGVAERVTLAAGARSVERIRPSILAIDAQLPPLAVGTYLLTGAYGGIGQLLCAWLLERGATRILLVGRPRSPPAVPPHCTHLCDDVLHVRAEDLTSVVGVFHCAGASADASLPRLQASDMSRVLYAKLEGAWYLHTLSLQLPAAQLRYFVLFSSVASALGSAGQAAYAMANGALDGIAALRRASNLPVLTLNWGPWRDVGMARRLTKAATEGIYHLFAPEEATQLLSTALTSSASQLILVRAKWSATSWAKRSADRLSALLTAPVASKSSEAASAVSAEARSIVSDIEALVQGASQVPHADETFAALGVDSLMAIELRDTLAALFSIPLPGSLVYDRPTLRLCATHIRSLLGTIPPAVSPSTPSLPVQPPSAIATTDNAIAVVGFACRFPGAANDLASLWRLLESGTDAISSSPPAGRWSDKWNARMATTKGGFLSDVELFDAAFFGISPREARLLDPQQRLLLELSWEALESAAQLPLRDTRVGVWVGVSSHDYESLIRSGGECGDPYFATGNGHSVSAGRLSYFFGLTGPSMSVDTACSSSLVGTHLARQALLARECNMALVGGVNLILQPELSAAFSAAGMLSPDGQCRTFDSSASGYVRSEGAAVLLLKRLSDAISSCDTVLAVIGGSAVNQDGRSNGLTAPSGPAQSSVIRTALASASLSAADISYVEAHGTGTVLGDAVELGALTEVFQPEKRAEPLQLGSVKSNFGHTEAAAGLAAMGKVLCMLRSRQVPPHLHLKKPNPALTRGLSVSSLLHDWSTARLIAGVSSFGFSGTNAHIIVEEAPASAHKPSGGLAVELPLVLSAHTHRALVARTKAILSYLDGTGETADWASLCYTLACRRQHFAHRTVITASDANTARAALHKLLPALSGVDSPPPSPPRLQLHVGRVANSALAFAEIQHHFDEVKRLAEADPTLAAKDWREFALQYAASSVAIAATEPDLITAYGISLIAVATAVGALTLVDALRLALTRVMTASSVNAPRVPLGDPVSGQTWSTKELTAVDFWTTKALSSPAVRNVTAIATFIVHVGSDDTLRNATTVPRIWGAEDSAARSLRDAMESLWKSGRPVDWARLFSTGLMPVVDLPPYPFERARHWIDAVSAEPHLPVVPKEDKVESSSDVNALLRVVLAELQELLRMTAVPPARQLTELGFDSIMGLELIERLARRTIRRLKLDTLFAQPTAQAIAQLLAAAPHAQVETAKSAPTPSAPAVNTESFPLTPLQRSYYIAAADPAQPSCHLFLEYEFEGDVQRLQHAWNLLIARHEMLRAVFTDEAEQRVLSSVPTYEFQHIADRQLGAVQARMRHQKFNPHKWPLFEICYASADKTKTLLLISLDFLVFDLSSLSLLFIEWRTLCANPQAELPPVGNSFREFVTTASARSDPAAEAYWASRLDEFPNGPPLPQSASFAARPARPPVYAHLERAILSQTWSTSQQRLRAHGLTGASALLGCYAAVLNGWTTDLSYVIVATLFRPPPGSRHLIGDFSTTALFVVDAEWRRHTLAQLLAAVQTRWLADLSHSTVEGPELMQRLAKKHGRTPEMPVVFTAAVKDSTRLDWDAWLGVRRTRVSQTPNVLLDCQVHETGAGELIVAWDYATEAFPPSLINDMFDAFVRVISSLAVEESWVAPPAALPQSHRTLYAEINATEVDLGSADELLHEPFYRTAASTPDAPCVFAANAELTYGQVALMSTSLAGRLMLPSSSRVGILLPKGWQQVVAALAILRAGTSFIPLDVHWPEERLRIIASLAPLAAIVSSSVHKPKWFPADQVILIDAHANKQSPKGIAECQRVSSSSEAYMIFTSGSTGLPKGVAISHLGALNTVRDVNKRFSITPSDRVFGLSELHFDLSIWDIFGALAVGASLVIPPPEAKRDPSMWLSLVQRHGVSVWNSVPRLAELLTEEQEATPVKHAIRLVLLSGDWIPISLPAKLRRSFGDNVELISMGGATEASIWSVLYPIPKELPPAVPSVLYGRPMLNQTMHILDGALNERPFYVPGELFIGGIGVAMHYLDAAHTAKSFIVHPRLGRLYRTGDNARWHPDGNIEFLGRRDTQAKIAGVRVELGEIEATALAVPGVKNAVAIVKNDVLVLHYVGQVDVTVLRTHLAARLPAAVCPSLLLRRSALPLTSNGKIDRNALVADSASEPTSAAAAPSVAPSAVQQQVLKEWAQLLPAPVSLDSNVFAAGATSLSIIRLATRLRRTLGISVAAAALLKLSTPREQAALVESTLPAPTSLLTVPARREPLPASFSQQHMWHAEQLDGDTRINTVALAVDIEGPLSLPPLRAALKLLVTRHEALQLSLVELGGQLCLSPVHGDAFNLQEVQVPSDAELTARVESLAAEPWHHKGSSPVRAYAVRRGDTHTTLVLIFHHAVIDGWSSGILARELSAAYNDLIKGQQPSLPQLSVQHPDYALWEQDTTAQLATPHIGHWKAILCDSAVPLATLPPPPPRAVATSVVPTANVLHFELDKELVSTARAAATASSASLFTMLLSAFVALLYRRTAMREFIVGTITPGRSASPSLEETVGCFINFVPIVCKPGAAKSFTELVTQLVATWQSALAHELPLHFLRKHLGLAETPFRVLFILQNPVQMPAFQSCRVERRNLHAPATEFDLTVSLEENPNGMELSLEYATTAIANSYATRLGYAYSALLRHALSAPGSPLSDLRTVGSDALATGIAEKILIRLCTDVLERRLSLDDHWAAMELPEAKRKAVLNALRRALPQLQYRELQNAGTLSALAYQSQSLLE